MRSDITYVIEVVTCYASNLSNNYKKVVSIMLCYFQSIINHDLIYIKHNNEIINYNDLDYISNINIYHFIIKYVFYFTKEFITARSTFIKTIALSIIKTEYMILYSTA